MRFTKEKFSLVLNGAWNPAILAPDWVAEHVLNKKGEDLPVVIDMPAPFTGGPWRLHIDGIIYVPHRNRLLVSPDLAITSDTLRSTAGFVKSVLSKLPHTPISAMGHNFGYEEESPSDLQLSLVTAPKSILIDRITSEQVDISRQETVTQFRLADCSLNLKFYYEGGKFYAEFNFHYAEKPLAALRESLPDSFLNNFEYSKKMMKELFNADVSS